MDSENIKSIGKEYMKKLLDEENIMDRNVDSDTKEGPACAVAKESDQSIK